MHRVSWEEVDGDPTLVISTVSCVREETRSFLASFSHFIVPIRISSSSFSSSLSLSLQLSFWKPSADLPSLSVRPYIRPSVQPAHQPTLRPSLSLIRRKRSIHHGRLRVPTFLGGVGLSRIVATDLVLLPSSFLLMYTFDVMWYISGYRIYNMSCCSQKEIEIFATGFIWNLNRRHECMEHITYLNFIIFNIW